MNRQTVGCDTDIQNTSEHFPTLELYMSNDGEMMNGARTYTE